MSISQRADIHIQVTRDDAQDIASIQWQASDAPEPGMQACKAMILALWDAERRESMRIDLWTKDMTVQDMNDFVFQTLLSLAESYHKATGNTPLMAELKHFAKHFAEQAYQREAQQRRPAPSPKAGA